MSAKSNKRDNHRRYHRHGAYTTIALAVLDEKGTPMREGLARAVDVSEGGCMLETAVPLQEGDPVCMTVDSGEGPTDVHGEVRRIKEIRKGQHRVGIALREDDMHKAWVFHEIRSDKGAGHPDD